MKLSTKYTYLLLVFLSLSVIGQMKRNDPAVGSFKEKNYFKTIDLLEKTIKSKDKAYQAQANYLIGSSYLALGSLYELASMINSEFQLEYYEILKNDKHYSDIFYLDLYAGLSAAESGKFRTALKFLKIAERNTSLASELRSIASIWKSYCENKLEINKELPASIMSEAENNSLLASEIAYVNTLLGTALKSSLITSKSYTGNLENRFHRNLMVLSIKAHDLEKATEYYNKLNVSVNESVEKSVANREIKFYDPGLNRALSNYFYAKAREAFTELSRSGYAKYKKVALEYLCEVNYKIRNYNEVLQFAKSIDDSQKGKLYSSLSLLKTGDKKKAENLKRELISVESVSEYGLLTALDLGDLEEGLDICAKTYQKNATVSTAFNYGYLLLATGDSKSAEEVLDRIYDRSQTRGFSSNSPNTALLYSMSMFRLWHKNAFPEITDIAQVLSNHYKGFNQYHYALQGIYASLGFSSESSIK